MSQRDYDIAELAEMVADLLSEKDGKDIVRIFNAEFANDEQQLSYNGDGQFTLDESQNGKVGENLPADKIKGRIKLIEPVYADNSTLTNPVYDHNDGTWWLVKTHLPEMFSGHYKIPDGSKMPKFSQFNVTSAIIVGNEDAPDEIWLTLVVEPKFNSKFWRAK